MDTKTQTKICIDCGINFSISSEDVVLYNKVGLELPAQCFECRFIQYSVFWPFGKFRKGTSDLSGENFITILPSKPRYPIYKSHEWWSDAWEPMSFGQVYDPSRSFFDQLKELQEKIPRPHQTGENSTGCEWCDAVWDSKNCYLSRSLARCENLSYGYRVFDTKDSNDIAISFNLQHSYDCLNCHNSFNLNFSENSKDCIDSYFLFDCRNCQNCFMSYNLRNKQYCIRNKQYTKEAYEEELKNIRLDSYTTVENLKKEFETILKQSAVHRENFNLKISNSTGNYLTNCDKCKNVFTFNDSQNCNNHIRGTIVKDSIDQFGTWKNEMSGNNSCVTGGYGIKHSSWSDSRYSEYLDLCIECDYCFGCVGLRKKQYCILNTQYTKEEYEKLREQIISDMKSRNEYGKFLPYSMSLCEYNFSTGIVYFPHLTKGDILKRGGYWLDEDMSSHDGISSLDLPDSIEDTDKNITTQALICPETNYRFNISPAEYEFHKNKHIALPRIHFDLRMLKKGRKTGVLKSYPYTCTFCKNDIMAYYPPEWGYEHIACENCYKQHIA